MHEFDALVFNPTFKRKWYINKHVYDHFFLLTSCSSLAEKHIYYAALLHADFALGPGAYSK